MEAPSQSEDEYDPAQPGSPSSLNVVESSTALPLTEWSLDLTQLPTNPFPSVSMVGVTPAELLEPAIDESSDDLGSDGLPWPSPSQEPSP